MLCLLLAAVAPPALDRHGLPLPTGAVARLGSSRLRGAGLGFDLLPDGKTVVTAGNPPWVDGDEVKFWDAATGERTRAFSHRWARAVVAPADGTRLAVHGGGEVSYWDHPSGRRLWLHPPKRGDGGADNIGVVAVSPGGKLVAVGGRRLALLDAATGASVRTLPRQERPNGVGAIAFSPDGALVAADDQTNLRLWEVATGRPVRTMDGKVGVSDMAFTPDGKHLLASGWHTGVPVWEVATGKLVRTLAGHTGESAVVAVSPDGRTVATSGGPGLKTANRTSGQDHDTHLYDLATGERRHVLPGLYTAAGGLRFTPDSKTLLTGDHTIRFWDVATGKQVRRQEGHEDTVADLAFDGDALVTAGLDNTVRRWNPRTGELLRTDPAGPSRPGAVVLGPAGRRACVVSATGQAVVTEVATGAELGRSAADRYQPPQFTPSGDGLLVAGHSGLTRLPFGGKPTTTAYPAGLEWPGGLSPDGKTAWGVVSAAPKKAADDRAALIDGPKPPFDLVLWDLDAGKESKRFRLSEHATWSARLVWSPDGRQVAVGNYGVFVGDLPTGQKRAEFWNGPSLDSDPVWSPDGRRLAFTQDEFLAVWDLAASRLAFPKLTLGDARSYRLRWSPDGTLLAAATGTTVLVYPIPPAP